MSKIMKSPKGVKSSVPERVSISCPTCGTRYICIAGPTFLIPGDSHIL